MCELQEGMEFASFVYCCLSNALNIRNTQQILWINGRNLFESITPAYEPSHTPFSVSTRAQLSPWHQLCSPFPSTQLSGGFGFTDNHQRMAPFILSIHFGLLWFSRIQWRKPKDGDEATEFLEIFQNTKGAGDSHGKTIPLPASALDHKERNGRMHCFHRDCNSDTSVDFHFFLTIATSH